IARYEDAAREFRAAYEITRQIELQYNVGRSLEAAGDLNGALQAYQLFMDAGAPGLDQEMLRTRMDNLRARLESQGGASTDAAQNQGAQPESTQPSEATASEQATPVVRFETRRSMLATVGPIAAMAVGLGLGGVAVWQALAANSDIG